MTPLFNTACSNHLFDSFKTVCDCNFIVFYSHFKQIGRFNDIEYRDSICSISIALFLIKQTAIGLSLLVDFNWLHPIELNFEGFRPIFKNETCQLEQGRRVKDIDNCSKERN